MWVAVFWTVFILFAVCAMLLIAGGTRKWIP